jgi:hypothetical protein
MSSHADVRGDATSSRTVVEGFSRLSIQIAWISQERGQVLEDVFVNRNDRRIIFLGRPEMANDKGERIYADDYQPLFHVEHAAGGSELEPLNIWRIVILTENNDQRFSEPFKQMIKTGLLPGFLEIYIERDLHSIEPTLTNNDAVGLSATA